MIGGAGQMPLLSHFIWGGELQPERQSQWVSVPSGQAMRYPFAPEGHAGESRTDFIVSRTISTDLAECAKVNSTRGGSVPASFNISIWNFKVASPAT
jgi:hypothetical protein